MLPTPNNQYQRLHFIFGIASNVFLASQAALIRPCMRALTSAYGEGRNCVWLCEQGALVHVSE
ncbi:MAG: hypothetical protein ACSLEZ_09315 [Thiobacillus sp.]